MWVDDKIRHFSRPNLQALIENRIPAVVIREFAGFEELARLAEALLKHASKTHSISQVTRLGISQYEQGVRVSKDNYFSLARQLNQEFATIYASSFGPVERLLNRLREINYDAAVMSEPGMGAYFAGNGKLRNGYSPIHVDYAPQDSEGWAVGRADVQLAWNLYLRVPKEGGELLLWDRMWCPDDDVHQVAGNYYYPDSLVAGETALKVAVKQGELVIINSRNFHAVADAEDRLAFGSFVSVFDKNKLRLWS